MRQIFSKLLFLVTCSTVPGLGQAPRLASVAEVVAIPEPPADARVYYGEDPLQFAELRVPTGDGPHPVVVLVHGGCWLSQYDVRHLGSMAEALADSGLAVWTLEFRRIGNAGGGWPGTFQDVSQGTDMLRQMAGVYDLDLGRVVIVGHSAGGHLALWLAARHRLPLESVLHVSDPLPIRGVIGLAPAADLELTYRNQTCGGRSQLLIGGSPEEFPERYREGSAAALLPLGIPQILINGSEDPGWLTVARAYREKALAAGDSIELIVPPGAGHFELVLPTAAAFSTVKTAIGSLLDP